MKKSTIKKVPKSSLIFKLLFCSLFIAQSSFSQSIQKTFTKELALEGSVTVFSKGPHALNYEMHGRISTYSGEKNYVIIAGSADSPTLEVKDYKVFTWNKPQIKQSVQIIISPDQRYPKEAQNLLDRLVISLEQDPSGRVNVDANMNISKFGFVNGFFKKNENTISLNDHSVYRIKSISINSSLYIPKNCNLELISKYIGLTIGDLEGQLKLNLSNGTVEAGNIENLEANLYVAKANFKNLGTAIVNAKSSRFFAREIDKLKIGYENFTSNKVLNNGSFFGDSGNSSLSKYNITTVDTMYISETTNDFFQLGTVGSLTAQYSTFSNYSIDKLLHKLTIKAKNGDLKIKAVSQNFESIDINNQVSSIQFGLHSVSDYLILNYPNNFTEYLFPEELKPYSGNATWQNSFFKGQADQAGQIKIKCNNCTVEVKN